MTALLAYLMSYTEDSFREVCLGMIKTQHQASCNWALGRIPYFMFPPSGVTSGVKIMTCIGVTEKPRICISLLQGIQASTLHGQNKSVVPNAEREPVKLTLQMDDQNPRHNVALRPILTSTASWKAALFAHANSTPLAAAAACLLGLPARPPLLPPPPLPGLCPLAQSLPIVSTSLKAPPPTAAVLAAAGDDGCLCRMIANALGEPDAAAAATGLLLFGSNVWCP